MINCGAVMKNETKTDCSELIFHDITLDVKPLIDSYTKPWMLECSDLSFANLYIWGANGKMEYAEKNNIKIVVISDIHFSYRITNKKLNKIPSAFLKFHLGMGWRNPPRIFASALPLFQRLNQFLRKSVQSFPQSYRTPK